MNQLTENKFLSEAEIQHLLKLCNRNKDTRDSILLRLILFSGARGQEILNMKKSDIKERGVIIYGLKGSNDRTIPIQLPFLKELKKYFNGLNSEDRLFNITTRRLRQIWKDWRLNPDKGIHSLRHSCGVRMYEHCEDLHAVKTVLGHKSIINTQVYLDFVESEKKLREKMEGLWECA